MSEEVFDLTGEGWDNIPDQVEADVPQYYKVPAGIYVIAFGKMLPKFKDINGKTCEQGTPGSSFSHASVPLWLIEYHGTAELPKNETILGSKLIIPDNKKVAELYYNLFISWDKADQWKNINMFKDFRLQRPNSQVVVNNPSGQGKVVRLKSLAYYYGKLMQINIIWSDKDNPYIDTKNSSIKILEASIKPELMMEFEAKINAKVEQERIDRQSKPDGGGYTPPATDLDDLDSFLNS